MNLFFCFIILKLSVCIGENYFVSNRNLFYDRTERSSTIILIINRLFKSRKTNSSVFRFIHFKVGRKSYGIDGRLRQLDSIASA